MILFYDEVQHRKFRVFISSTFSDMQKERDILVNSIFPRLRKEFSSYILDIIEVDLRWGISQNDADDGRILEICIGEVLRCNPYFVCILGDRYGSYADKDEIAALPIAYREALGDNINDDISITEMETIIGALGIEPNKYAYFLRRESERHDEKLEEFVHRIKEKYPVVSYDSELAFEELVFTKLKEYIIDILPTKVENPLNDPDYYSHLCFLKENVSKYVSNNLFIGKLESTLQRKHFLYIRGDKGSGKSACICWMIKRCGIDKDNDVFFHFSTAGNQSTRVENIFKRLRMFLEYKTGYTCVSEDNYSAVISILENNNIEKPIYCYFDAVEQYDDPTVIYKFFSFTKMNPKIYIICSGVDQYARIQSDCVINIIPLSADQIREITVTSLNRFGKHIEEEKVSLMVVKPQCNNPLFLQALITQIRMFGIYENLDSYFENLIDAESFYDMVNIIIKRIVDYFAIRFLDTEIIYKALALLVYSNKGISESELQDMAGFVPLMRSVFLISIELFLIEDDGILRFSHDLINKNIIKILENKETDYEKYARECMIEYYSENERNWRSYMQLPYNLHLLGRYEELLNELKDVTCFLYLLENDEYSLIGYLSVLKEYQFEIYEAIKDSIRENNIVNILHVFCEAGFHKTVKKIIENGIVQYDDDVQIALMDIYSWSQYEFASNHYLDAIEAYQKLLELYRNKRPDDEIGCATRSAKLAGVYKSAGKLELAFEMYRNSVEILDAYDVQSGEAVWAYDVYGSSCYGSGNLYQAIDVFERATDICKYLYGEVSHEQAWNYCYAWGTYYFLGEINKAVEVAKEAYEIYDYLYKGHGASYAWAAEIAGIASMLEKDFDKAEELTRISIIENDDCIEEELRPHKYSITAYCNLATLYFLEKRFDDANNTIIFAINQAKEKHGLEHVYTANILLNAGVILNEPEYISEAINIYEINGNTTPDHYFAKLCLSVVLGNNSELAKAKEVLEALREEYFNEYRETELITYLIYDASMKILGIIDDEIEQMYRYKDFAVFLSHNNSSNVLLIPKI